MATSKEIWTVRDVARWCGASVRTVLNWIERGDLKSFKLPGRGDNRIRKIELLDFLTRHGLPLPEGEESGRERRVLIVDDDAVAAKLIDKSLKLLGYETAVARDGFSAGAFLGSFQPAMITLDLKMPGLGGIQVIELVRSTPQYSKIKILVVSSMPKEELEKARRAGADDYLQKPVDYQVLQDRVTALLGRPLMKGRKSE